MAIDMKSLIIMIVVGLVAGWLAGQILKGRGLGLVGDIVVGILGSLLMAWVVPQLFHVSLPVIGGELVNTIVWATIGAIILLLIVGMVRKRA
jgi:uncharacterized membrane protein YeaQ/YmgE (transglycosylase-associated protein family)